MSLKFQEFMRDIKSFLTAFEFATGKEHIDVILSTLKKINKSLPAVIESDGLEKMLPFVASVYITTTTIISQEDDECLNEVDENIISAYKKEYMFTREWTRDLLINNPTLRSDNEFVKQAMEEIQEEQIALMWVD